MTINKETQNAARDTVANDKNIENNIRHIVVQALKEGQMQPEEIKQTLNEVIEGACKGVSVQSGSKDALKQVITGIDGALTQVAGASKLAIEEASGNLQEFSDHDLKRALNDLETLESLFFDSLNEVANKGQETAHETLKDLLSHFKNSGTSVGQSVKEMLTGLHHDLSKDGRLQKIQLADIAKSTGATVAHVASGLFAGIAESLELKKK
ncbi:MAG: hypothetical protein QM500_20560 [Methylococcales bacterium]